MRDLIVIGGGFWGYSCFARARESGMDPLLVDAEEDLSASPNATGLVVKSWYKKSSSLSDSFPDHWDFDSIWSHFQWVKSKAGIEETGFSFYNETTSEGREKTGAYLLPSDSDFLDLDEDEKASFRSGRVTTVQKSGDTYDVELETGESLEAENVILAAGAWTDRILRSSGYSPVKVESLLGRAFLIEPDDGDHKLPEGKPLKVMRAPYQFTWIREQYGQYRAGDSVEKIGCPEEVKFQDPLEETPYRDKFLSPVEDRCEDFQITGVRQGVRPSTPKVVVDEIDDGFVVATGGGRVGLALSGIASHDALSYLKEGQ